jgi:iron complex outermembrane receptor protein
LNPFSKLPSLRPSVLAVCLALSSPLLVHSAWAQSSKSATQVFDIPAGPLDVTLTRIARQSGQIISIQPEQLQGRTAAAIKGEMNAEQAYRQALQGSGLELFVTGSGALNLRPAPAAGTTTLPEVKVTANGGQETSTGPLLGYVAKRTTTGSKTDTAIIEIPQSISVITADEISDKGITTLTDALAQTPGVTVNPYGFDSRALDWVVLRGFDGWYTSNYRDGLIQNVGINFLGVQTEVYGLERLEVLRGPSSVLFGKGDVGGVVNRVSKLPSVDAPREVVVQTGSFGRKQVAADFGGALDDEGKLLYRVVGVGLDTGTQEKYPNGERMDQQRQYLAPSLRWQISPRTSLVMQAEYLRDDSSDDVQFVTANGVRTNVKEGDPNYSRIKSGTDAVGYQFEHKLDDGWMVQQKMRYARRTMDKHHISSGLDVDDVTLLRTARHEIESVDELTIDTSLQGTVQTGSVSHKLLFGLDWDNSRADWRRFVGAAPSLDIRNPVYGINIPEPTNKNADTQIKTTQLGLYVQDQIKFDKHWGLTFGLRRDHVKTDTSDYLNAEKTAQSDKATTGRIGLNYLIGNGWAPYISYATSFVPNIGIDAAGNNYKSSNGRQVEMGIKYMPEDSPISFAAALFNLEKTNVLSYDPAADETRQIGKIRSRGLELEAKAALSRQLRLTASFTALDLSVRESANPDEIGKTPVLTPEVTSSLWLDYVVADSSLRGLSFGSGLRYIGKRWNEETNVTSEPSYTLVDAAVRYDTGPWRFALNASNLFDKQYFNGGRSYYRGMERSILLTARYRF